MNAKQKLFCENYVACKCNATEAYVQTYDSKRGQGAEQNSSRLLKNPEVREYIAELIKEQYKNKYITAERVGSEIAEIAFSEDDSLRKADKLKALELLQKQLGLQTQKVEVSSDIVINITGKGVEEQ